MKGNIVRFLQDYDITIISYRDIDSIEIKNFDGIVISNGPGDPSHSDFLKFRNDISEYSEKSLSLACA